jgi:folate-binding protein YgfZ
VDDKLSETARRLQAARLDAAQSAWGVGPPEQRALFRAHGADARDYLHRMSTQDLSKLAPGVSAFTTFLDAKGHLLADAQVLAGEDGVLVEMDPAAAPGALAQLTRFVIADDVTFEDRSAGLRVLPVVGPRAGERAAVLAPGVPAIESRRRGLPAVDLVVPAEDAEDLRGALVSAGAAGLDADDLEVLRILGGRPRWGAELDASRLPMEAGLTCEAISFDKGCYIGQEVVLRATARGRLQKGLVLLALPAGASPGEKLAAAGQEVGWVTSAAEAPGGRIGLGYLRRAHWREGERLTVDGGEAVVKRVIVAEG